MKMLSSLKTLNHFQMNMVRVSKDPCVLSDLQVVGTNVVVDPVVAEAEIEIDLRAVKVVPVRAGLVEKVEQPHLQEQHLSSALHLLVNTKGIVSRIITNKVSDLIRVKLGDLEHLILVLVESLTDTGRKLVMASPMILQKVVIPSTATINVTKGLRDITPQDLELLPLRRPLLRKSLHSLKRFLLVLLQPSEVLDPAIALIKNFTELVGVLLAGDLHNCFFSNEKHLTKLLVASSVKQIHH